MDERKRRRRYVEDDGANQYVNEFVNTACDMVDITGLSPDVPKAFIIKSLIKKGRVAYLERNDDSRGWYNAAPAPAKQPNRYGYYDTLFLTQSNGLKGFYATVADGVKEIRANAEAYPLFITYQKYATQLALCDRAINANLRASIMTRMLTATDETQKEELQIALSEMEDGLPLIVTDDIRHAFEASDLSTDFIAREIIDVRSAIWADAAVRLGTISGNQYKKERVQSAEVDASVAETIDSVYIMVNTFNEDCERNGLPFRMVFTGYAARYDTPEEPTEREVQDDAEKAD